MQQAHWNTTAVQLMGLLMTRPSLEIQSVLELTAVLDHSYIECQKVIKILCEVFTKEKSGRILLAVEILEYLVKNCNKNFHQAANKKSFQTCLLGLLKRLRGKSNFLKDLRSNSDNWDRIQAKVLYLVQLWYDAFILEESVFDNIVGTYKTLRKENVTFPPRSVNEKNLLNVKTQSPIFQNIEDIARQDHQKFGKKLSSMGLERQAYQMDQLVQKEEKKRQVRKVDVEDFGLKIAIVRSNEYQGADMLKLIEEIKRDMSVGRVDTGQEKDWKMLREAAESMVREWEEKNAELIQKHEQQYLQAKLGRMGVGRQSEVKEEHSQPPKNSNEVDFDIFGAIDSSPPPKQEEHTKKVEEINLLDL